MSQPPCDPGTFYRERVPAQFNRTLEAQERLAAGDEAAARLLAAMCSVNTSITVVVRGAEGEQRFHLDVVGGRMRAVASPSHPPFMTLIHDLDTFATLERESGDSILGFLGAIAGMREDMKLTSQRVQNLYGLAGSLRVELTGGEPLELTAHFGSGPIPAEPGCCIAIDSGAYAELRSGELAPQDAFMSGKIEVQGDMQLAMQLALAALSPE